MMRRAAVAGVFYPAEPEVLRRAVAGFSQPVATDRDGTRPKALIVPHAGYVYSGAVAGIAYARLRAHAGTIRRVVLLGPVHRVPVRGLALPEADAFATPLGTVPVDAEAVRRLIDMPQVRIDGEAHAQEHALEVQLPFLQSVLDDFTVVPLAVGDAAPEEVAEVIEALWGGPETLIVVSSDLSHYLPQEAAERVDRDTIEHILSGRLLESFEQACGAVPIDGLLIAARRHGLTPRLLDRRTSGDTAGDRLRVVGYAALEFVESPDAGGPPA